MSTTTYKLGRDAVSTIPGISNDDIIDVTANVSADELDVTTFGSTAITTPVYMAGLVDVTVDVVCTHHTCTIGQHGAQVVAGLPSGYDAVVLDVKESANPKGKAEFTVTYGLVQSSGS